MDDGGRGYGHGGDHVERNEAISAVADEGFIMEEEDDDYEDLYNDVNVGEGFLQSLKRNDEPAVAVSEVGRVDMKIDPPVQFSGSQPAGGVVSQANGSVTGGSGGGATVSERGAEGFGNQRGSVGGVAGGGLRVELGQANREANGSEEQNFGPGHRFGQPQIQQPPLGGGGGAQGFFPHQQPPVGGDMGGLGNEGFGRGMNVNGIGSNGVNNVGSAGMGGGGGMVTHAGFGGIGGSGGGGAGSGGGTMLFVGDLHWWTTDAELEAELCKYGVVKEVKFFDEKASGKSKGYCQVEFYDPGAAAACKEGMNGHVFNGRPCVVAFASPFSVKKMGDAQVNRTQQTGQAVLNQPRRTSDNGAKPAGNNIAAGGNYQGGADNNRGGYGRGNWGRGNSQGMGNRGGGSGGMRRGGGMGGRGIMGNGGNAFNQGMGGNPQMMNPQAMMAQGFDPAFGGPMGRMGGYGGFPGGPMGPYPGMMQSFPPVGGMAMPGVAPHVNPAFFGRGMPMNGMGMAPTSGMDGPMWQDPSMGGWGGDDHPSRGRESSYGEEVASDQYGEAGQDRVGRHENTKEKDRGSERDWSASSDKKYRDEKGPRFDREVSRENENGPNRSYADSAKHHDDRDITRPRDRSRSREHERERERMRDREKERERERIREKERERERDRYRDERDKYPDSHRPRDRESERDVEWERGPSSRTHSKSRYDDDRRPRSRDADYGKKRHLSTD